MSLRFFLEILTGKCAGDEIPVATEDVELLRASNSMKSQLPVPEVSCPSSRLTLRCEWCLEPFEREPRTIGEIEKLQQVLFITGPAVTRVPAICDVCYGNVVGSALHYEQMTVGASNSGPSNLMLRASA